jgi:Uma2 family endonuclease
MNIIATPNAEERVLPNHTQLPDQDGKHVINFQEPAQSRLLTETLEPLLTQWHPDQRYCIGRDCGIYWRYTDPPLRGCKAPDWYYVPGVPALLEGRIRRSYVLWDEVIAPRIVIEYVSGDGTEERDQTPMEGKFWVYEQAIRAPYYAIFEPAVPRLEVHHSMDGRYHLLEPNEHGRFLIEPMGVELGIWQGRFENLEAPWLRWWDTQGNLLPTADERAAQERRDKEEALQRAARLAEQLRALGVDPDKV